MFSRKPQACGLHQVAAQQHFANATAYTAKVQHCRLLLLAVVAQLVAQPLAGWPVLLPVCLLALSAAVARATAAADLGGGSSLRQRAQALAAYVVANFGQRHCRCHHPAEGQQLRYLLLPITAAAAAAAAAGG
jgi:hypothetical protein